MNYQTSFVPSNHINPVQENAVIQAIQELEALKTARPIPVKRLKLRVPTPNEAVVLDQDQPNMLLDADDYQVSLADEVASQIKLQRRLAHLARHAQRKRERLIASVVMVTCATGVLLGSAVAVISG